MLCSVFDDRPRLFREMLTINWKTLSSWIIDSVSPRKKLCKEYSQPAAGFMKVHVEH